VAEVTSTKLIFIVVFTDFINIMERFSTCSDKEIDLIIENSVPENTTKTKKSILNQFKLFCAERNHDLTKQFNKYELNIILKDWAINMCKQNKEQYKESTVKTIWNITAKYLQEYYYNTFNLVIDPFKDIEFKQSRDARNAKRRVLQAIPSKRKSSAVALNEEEIYKIIDLHDENSPSGLQKKFFHLASYELAWRGGEAKRCLTHYFKEECRNDGSLSGRIEYNPIFTKTTQGGSNKCAESKWLTTNIDNTEHCPVRVLKKLLSKRTNNIKSDRLFLTENPFWKKEGHHWFKNMPIGINEISKWTKSSARKIGIDVDKNKVTNHSYRSSAVSHLVKHGVSENDLIKITGHGSAQSLKPYLQMDNEHHESIINQLRQTSSIHTQGTSSITNISTEKITTKKDTPASIIYNNCTFHVQNMHY
jgi:integrase